ncbi:Trihelix transcription factor GT-2 [Morus notabilis]|uniref:Trihelix transcription factor GT-2 n=1 Tax=Morus notabilis TaxID=981085 RepID=W9RGP4_9ROSA|nr:trihelix transcription factor GT-2 [Morus notabilis]EXB76035.1 Trihelix transcription factor GT-2 [Morus notabilis]
MLENPTFPENLPENGGGSVPVGVEEEERVRGEEGDRSWLGNRWPRQETLALLEIRSDMDSKFRDSSVKAPLWEDISRKMGELGYNRSAKKCKEKFENIYKYHKRTRDGRSGRANGKNYRFFEQLEALDHHSFDPPSMEETRPTTIPPNNVVLNAIPCSVHKPVEANFDENSSSSTSSSGEESEGARKKKRKLTRFFERLMKEVMERQESLQRKFIETLEKCEQDRIAREEAWKAQELERLKRESELLVHERAIAAAKDAAVLAFLKKFSEQSDQVQFPENPIASFQKDGDKQEKSQGGNLEQVSLESQEKGSNHRNFSQMSSSRWPKDEVDALIRLRTNLDVQYQDNGPKGPLWEDISAAMRKIGYDRSSKRCKEKWENINKYFKRVKDSNKKRVEDSKTCPYFYQLDALYNKKTKKANDSVNSGYDLRPEELLMHMMGSQEEQQQRQLESVTDQDGEESNDKVDGDGYQTNTADNNPSQMTVDNPPSMETMG